MRPADGSRTRRTPSQVLAVLLRLVYCSLGWDVPTLRTVPLASRALLVGTAALRAIFCGDVYA